MKRRGYLDSLKEAVQPVFKPFLILLIYKRHLIGLQRMRKKKYGSLRVILMLKNMRRYEGCAMNYSIRTGNLIAVFFSIVQMFDYVQFILKWHMYSLFTRNN